MRLTLRMMLAWIDGVLRGRDYADIGWKIEKSPVAGDLVVRLTTLPYRRQLPAPSLADPAFDPNDVAEYLDNCLPPPEVERLERICLDSDVNLCELAACHRLAVTLLGRSIKVRKSTRLWMYELPDLLQEATSRDVRFAAMRGTESREPLPDESSDALVFPVGDPGIVGVAAEGDDGDSAPDRWAVAGQSAAAAKAAAPDGRPAAVEMPDDIPDDMLAGFELFGAAAGADARQTTTQTPADDPRTRSIHQGPAQPLNVSARRGTFDDGAFDDRTLDDDGVADLDMLEEETVHRSSHAASTSDAAIGSHAAAGGGGAFGHGSDDLAFLDLVPIDDDDPASDEPQANEDDELPEIDLFAEEQVFDEPEGEPTYGGGGTAAAVAKLDRAVAPTRTRPSGGGDGDPADDEISAWLAPGRGDVRDDDAEPAAATLSVPSAAGGSGEAPRHEGRSGGSQAVSEEPSERLAVLRSLGAAMLESRQAMVAVAAVLVIAIGAGFFHLLRAETPPPLVAAAHVYGLGDAAATCELAGQIQVQHNGTVQPDSGALVIAWPVNGASKKVYTSAEIYADVNATSQGLHKTQLYTALAGVNGEFRLRVAPNDSSPSTPFQVAVVSFSAAGQGEPPADQQKLLGQRVKDPAQLIGKKALLLQKLELSAGRPAELKHTFQTRTTARKPAGQPVAAATK